jgi:hypothetical protein
VPAQKGQRDRGAVDQARRHRRQDLAQLRLGMDRTRRRVDQRDRLSQKFDAAHKPVQDILQRTGNAVRVFRRRDQKPVAPRDLVAQRPDDLRPIVRVQVRVEVRRSPSPRMDDNIRVGRARMGAARSAALLEETARKLPENRENTDGLAADTGVAGHSRPDNDRRRSEHGRKYGPGAVRVDPRPA